MVASKVGERPSFVPEKFLEIISHSSVHSGCEHTLDLSQRVGVSGHTQGAATAHSLRRQAGHKEQDLIGHSAPVPGWALPALFETGDTWVLLAESDLGAGGYGARLDAEVDGREYRLGLPHPAEGLARTPLQIQVGAGWESSWRVLVVGELATVVESNLVTDLATPAQVDDVSWVRPGRVSWSWWSEHDSPQDPAALRRYIDLAADMGWEHTLIDANWNLMAAGAIEDLIAYADARGVGVFLWYNSGGPNNQVTEPAPGSYEFEPMSVASSFYSYLGVQNPEIVTADTDMNPTGDVAIDETAT